MDKKRENTVAAGSDNLAEEQDRFFVLEKMDRI